MIGFEVFTIDREGEPLHVNNSHSVMMLVIGSLMGRPDHGRDSTRVENWALVLNHPDDDDLFLVS